MFRCGRLCELLQLHEEEESTRAMFVDHALGKVYLWNRIGFSKSGPSIILQLDSNGLRGDAGSQISIYVAKLPYACIAFQLSIFTTGGSSLYLTLCPGSYEDKVRGSNSNDIR